MPAPAISNQLAEAFSRRTPNERRLLAGLAVVALAVAPVKALSFKDDATTRNEAAHAELDRVQLLVQRNQGSVGGQLASERGAVQAWSWRAENAEVGSVLVQNRLAEMAEQAGLADIDVKVNGKAVQAGGVHLVPLELTADFNWRGVSGLLSSMESSGKGFVIDSVQKPDSDKPRLKLNVRVPIVLTTTPAQGAST